MDLMAKMTGRTREEQQEAMKMRKVMRQLKLSCV
jgi:phosphopantothenoylcysteine synthetase/decarboxylase